MRSFNAIFKQIFKLTVKDKISKSGARPTSRTSIKILRLGFLPKLLYLLCYYLCHSQRFLNNKQLNSN